MGYSMITKHIFSNGSVVDSGKTEFLMRYKISKKLELPLIFGDHNDVSHNWDCIVKLPTGYIFPAIRVKSVVLCITIYTDDHTADIGLAIYFGGSKTRIVKPERVVALIATVAASSYSKRLISLFLYYITPNFRKSPIYGWLW